MGEYYNMKIYDCFQYFNEDTILDLLLNILSELVKFFVVVEFVAGVESYNFFINNCNKIFVNSFKF